MKRFVVVSGLPASGKTTVEAAVASALGLPLLDKDAILETLFAKDGIGDPRWRSRLSRIADDLLQSQAVASDGAVISSSESCRSAVCARTICKIGGSAMEDLRSSVRSGLFVVGLLSLCAQICHDVRAVRGCLHAVAHALTEHHHLWVGQPCQQHVPVPAVLGACQSW